MSDRLLERPDGRIAYTVEGHGPLVVLVPGMGDVKEEYRYLTPYLVNAGFAAAAMDLRGLGGSSVGWPAYTNAALGSDVVALVDHLGTTPVAVVGTSMGAGAAAWAAAERPDAITRLVLIGPFVREPPSGFATSLKKTLMKFAFAGSWAVSAWGLYWTSLYPTRKPPDFAEYRARLLKHLREPGRMEATRAMAEAPKADVEQRLHAVRARTLVVMGSKDPDFSHPAVEAAEVARLLRGTHAMVPAAGHYPHAEMPRPTAAAILDFLAPRASKPAEGRETFF